MVSSKPHAANSGHRTLRFFGRAELTGILNGGGVVDPCTLVCCYRYLGVAG